MNQSTNEKVSTFVDRTVFVVQNMIQSRKEADRNYKLTNICSDYII